jgi:hypothetical protein
MISADYSNVVHQSMPEGLEQKIDDNSLVHLPFRVFIKLQGYGSPVSSRRTQ